MKYILFGCIATMLLFGCGGEQPAEESERTELRIGTDATYPPFEMVNPETGEVDGFDIDLMKEICRINDWTPEFIVTPFDGIIQGLKNRKYDVIISALTITPERAVAVRFSDPYYLAGQTIAVPLEDSTIHGVDDLKGERVGVQLGTTGELMAKKMAGVQVYSYDNIGAAFIDMDNGNLDAVLNDFPTTQSYIRRHGTARTVGEILSEEYYGMAVRPKDDSLLAVINRSLRHVRSSGVYEQLHLTWFDAPPALPAEPDSVVSE